MGNTSTANLLSTIGLIARSGVEIDLSIKYGSFSWTCVICSQTNETCENSYTHCVPLCLLMSDGFYGRVGVDEIRIKNIFFEF